jgi:ribosomal protein L37AE/L43A
MKKNVDCPKCFSRMYQTSDNIFYCKRCGLTLSTTPKGEKNAAKQSNPKPRKG